MDIVLFFDALDEFDGHLDMISRFLKNIVKESTKSGTRVKVCFSSRPWESLKKHFSSYPGFSLQDYTKDDIEHYATRSLATLRISYPSIIGIVSTIIDRANGVFIWVKLALKELFDTAILNPKAISRDLLEKKLQEFPTDLYEFYQLVIERINSHSRRRTFVLLELLIRQVDPPATAVDIRDAVLISGCTTLSKSRDELEKEYAESAAVVDVDKRVRNDIYTWGGGLVEVKTHNGVDRPQLMHQTVLDFAMGLPFKTFVIGNLAILPNENGYSFHLKYWMSTRSLGPMTATKRTHRITNSELKTFSELTELEQIAYYAEQSEVTTGKSQIGFISSIDPNELQQLIGAGSHLQDPTAIFLAFAAEYGLTLCLRDWLSENQCQLGRVSHQRGHLPLLSSLVFGTGSRQFHERYLATARLLLDNGFNMEKDPNFFITLLNEIWASEFEASDDARKIPKLALFKLATLVLDHGQDPNITTSMFLGSGLNYCRPLHIATPTLSVHLIQHGADTNVLDSKGRTPLDWVLEFPTELYTIRCNGWEPEQRYIKCKILLSAGGLVSHWTTPKINALAEFERKGYDTRILRENLRSKKCIKKKRNWHKPWRRG